MNDIEFARNEPPHLTYHSNNTPIRNSCRGSFHKDLRGTSVVILGRKLTITICLQIHQHPYPSKPKHSNTHVRNRLGVNTFLDKPFTKRSVALPCLKKKNLRLSTKFIKEE